MQRHDLNTHFQWQETSGPYRLISDTQAQQYDAAGYFLFENAFSADEIAAVRGAIDPLEEHYTAVLRDKLSARQRQAGADSAITAAINRADAITFSIHLVKRAQILKDFSRHPVFQGLCHDLIGPGARLYWDQAVYKKPGNPEDFPWHQDNGYTFTEPQQYLTCWVALTDATTENGCPWVLPGVHLGGTLAHQMTPIGLACLSNPQGSIAVPAKAGDIVVFSSLTPHRTGPNLTDQTRRAYILQYASDGCRIHTEAGVMEANDPDRQFYVEP